jgi:transposase
MGDLDIASLLFALPDGIFISSVRATTTELVVRIACQRSCAACPLCQQTSERVHGNYVRTVADLPCAGRRVILALTVRKFVCSAPTCPRQIFTERLPDLVPSYARMTNRLREALVALGLATSSEVSERLAPKLGMLVSAPTLLRRLRAVACPPPTSVRILGVDDWAWKKGQTYGTILVDLEKRCPIELLPDRKEETLTAWLLTHPEIDVISRDPGRRVCGSRKERRSSSSADCGQIPPGGAPHRRLFRSLSEKGGVESERPLRRSLTWRGNPKRTVACDKGRRT